MKNSTINNINSTKHGENKLENDESDKNNEGDIESKKAEETVFKHNNKVIMKHSDDSWIKVDSVDAPSIVLKDIVIDMKDKQEMKRERNKKNNSKSSKWFKRFLARSLKKPKNTKKSSNNLNQRRKTKMCVLFSFGRCGYDDDDDEYYDDEMLDDPDPRGTYVTIVLTIVVSMMFSTAAFLIIVYNVPRLYIIFHKPSLSLFLFSLGGLLFVYFSMLCLSWGYETPCGYILLVFTVIFVSLVAAIMLCSLNAVAVIHGFLGASAVVLTCIGLACTSFDFTSFWLYLIVISCGFTVVALSVVLSTLVTGVHIIFLHLIILLATTLLHSLAFIMELQMILGGKSIEVDYHNYAMGAFMLYTSVMDIFLKIISLSGLIHD